MSAVENASTREEMPERGTRFEVLKLLDSSACRLHVSREELVLALSDKSEAKRFKQKHGIDPRSISSLLAGLFAG